MKAKSVVITLSFGWLLFSWNAFPQKAEVKAKDNQKKPAVAAAPAQPSTSSKTGAFKAIREWLEDKNRYVQRVQISHLLMTGATLPSIALAPGDVLEVTIADTDPQCYHYSFEQREEPRDQPKGRGVSEMNQQVKFQPHVHDEDTISYLIGITSRGGTNCDSAFNRNWELPVKPYWTISAAGAFIGDHLIKPNYFLKDGTRAETDGSTTDGFFVTRDKNGEDDYRLGGGALIHVYRRNQRLPFLRGVNWVPVTFGLGLSNDTTYLAGTSLKFGNGFYVTLGKVFGNRERLPNGVAIGDFTENASLLTTLGKKQDSAAFLGFSYSFLRVPASVFSFGGKLQPDSLTGPRLGGQGSVLKIDDVNPAEQSPGENVEITGSGFGATQGNSTVSFSKEGLEAPPTNAEVVANGWSDTKITIKVPTAEGLTGEVKLQVNVEGKTPLERTFTILAPPAP